MTALGRLVGPCRLAFIFFAGAVLSGCSGGGGGGGSGGGSTGDLRLSASSVTFQALASDPAEETFNVQITWSNPRVAGIAVGTLPGQTLPNWLNVTAQGNTSPVTMVLRRLVNGNGGLRSTTIRVVSGDANFNVIDVVDLPVSFEVVPLPVIAPGALNVSWVESEQPASQHLALTRDNRVQVVSIGTDVTWLSASSVGDALTVSGNAQSQLQAPGPLAGNLLATIAFNGRQRVLAVPVTASVGRALIGPGSLTTEVNASTVPLDLVNNLSLNITTATQAALQFNASSNVPWLTASGGTTASPNNLSLTLLSAQLEPMANGIYPGIVTLTAPNVSPLQIPVSLNLRLPEVHFVAPVAFSDTVATDFVIARGAGFDDPNAAVQLAGVPVVGATKVSDTEIRFVPGSGAATAGTYEVKVPNGLNLNRSTANLRVTGAPTYATTSLDAAIGFQARVISSPINGAVFTQKCFLCSGGLSVTGTLSTVQRFAFDSVGGTWTRTEHPYTNLYDIALTPDESTLLVLTDTKLLLVNPQTMVTNKTVNLPATFSGISRQLAVMNNGLVIIQALNKAYSLRADSFVTVNGLSVGNAGTVGGIQASRDGSRAIFGEATNGGDVAYRYYDASTGNVVISGTNQFYGSGAYSRHADKAFVTNFLLDANLASLGTVAITSISGDLSPDGNRVYGLDFGISPPPLRAFNVAAAPFTELTPISLTGLVGLAQVAFDPRGNALFVVSEGKFFVIDLR